MYAVHHGVSGVQLRDWDVGKRNRGGVIAVGHSETVLSGRNGAGVQAGGLRPLLDQFNQAEFAEVGYAHLAEVSRITIV